MSAFERLLQLGRNTVLPKDFDPKTKTDRQKRRIENFLTETLALAIKTGWAPIGRALGNSGIFDESAGVIGVSPATQQRVGTLGTEGRTVDLVLAVDRRSGPAEAWVEVKAGAPMHGDQLEAYLSHMTAACHAEPGVPRELVLIDNAPPPPAYVGLIRSITWQRIHDAVTPEDGAVWAELRHFLSEAHLVRPRDHAPESHSTEELARALSRGLSETSRWSWVHWAKGARAEWERVKTITTNMRNNQQDTGDRVVRVWAPRWFVRLEAGEFLLDGQQWGVRLAVSWWYPVAHGFMRRRAKASGLSPAVWSFGSEREDDTIIAAYRPVGGDPEELTAWIVDRARELNDADLLVVIDGDGEVHH